MMTLFGTAAFFLMKNAMKHFKTNPTIRLAWIFSSSVVFQLDLTHHHGHNMAKNTGL